MIGALLFIGCPAKLHSKVRKRAEKEKGVRKSLLTSRARIFLTPSFSRTGYSRQSPISRGFPGIAG